MGRGGFNAVIGNPPYIRIQNMAKYSPDEVGFFRNSDSPYSTAEQDIFDKYLLFVERSIGLVNDNGRIGVIIPHKFMTIQSGRVLRRLISEGRLLDEVVHFGAKQVFGTDASNYTCILILDRSTSDTVRIERPKQLNSWRYGKSGSVDIVSADELDENPWPLADTETSALFDRIRATFPDELGAVAEIFVGVQTSADKIYIFEATSETATTCNLRWDDRDWTIERGILRPSLLDVRLQPFERPKANTWIIFPYDLVQNTEGRVRAHLIQPTDMAKRFPGCWAYLEARRAKLESRNIVGGLATERQWYQYGRSQSITKFGGEKIILPILSRGPNYAFDDRDILVTGGGNGPYYLIRCKPNTDISNHYLLAVLNHQLSEAFVRTSTSVFRGGYYSHGKQFIETLPIPIPNNDSKAQIEALVGHLIDKQDALGLARTPQQRTQLIRSIDDLKLQIEHLINGVFGLSEDDLAVVNAVPVPD